MAHPNTVEQNTPLNTPQDSSLNYKYCTYCGRPIPRNAEYFCCPQCQDLILFRQVREYIRENDVNEFQVADHFGIPLRMVKHWIREGRIEYKTDSDNRTIQALRCSRCGAPATFGSLCSSCLKLLNKNVHGYGARVVMDEEEKMRFLDITSENH